MWELYDRMIEGIPHDWKAEEIFRGTSFACVLSNNGLGIAEPRPYDLRKPLQTKNLEGASLREVAACIKSWNFFEAATGLAAINAYYNNIDVARGFGVTISESLHIEDRIFDPFIMSQNTIRGKKVTVVGHFPHITQLMAPVCDLSIIAVHDPQQDDYPLSAAEFLLPESDFVYISSSTLIDKTMPRLLELSRNAQTTTIVGPSTPLAPVLFAFGAHDLSGFVVKDRSKAKNIIRGAENNKIFATGQKVAFKIHQYQQALDRKN